MMSEIGTTRSPRRTFNWRRWQQRAGTEIHQHALDALPNYLLLNERWDELAGLLTDVVQLDGTWQQPWAVHRDLTTGSFTPYIDELDALWRHADQRNLNELALRCTLIRSSIHGRSGAISADLMLGLIRTVGGRWTLARALEWVRALPDLELQLNAYTTLVQQIDELSTERALDVALEAPAVIRSRMVHAVLALLPDAILGRIVAALPTMTPDEGLALMLFDLVPRLPATSYPRVREAIAAFPRPALLWAEIAKLSFAPVQLPQETIAQYRRLRRMSLPAEITVPVILRVAPELPPDMRGVAYTEALDLAFGVRLPPRGMLSRVTNAFMGPFGELFQQVQAQPDLDAIEDLAHRLPSTFWSTFVERLPDLNNGYFCSRLLSTLAARATPTDAALLVGAAEMIKEPVYRLQVIVALDHLLPAEQRSARDTELSAAVPALIDYGGAKELTRDIYAVRPALAPIVYGMLTSLSIDEPWYRAQHYGLLARYLDGEAADDATARSAAAIDELRRRDRTGDTPGEWLVSLAPYAPPSMQASLYEEAWHLATKIDDGDAFVTAWRRLAPLLSDATLVRAGDAAAHEIDVRRRAVLLTTCARRRPDRGQEALAAVLVAEQSLSPSLSCLLIAEFATQLPDPTPALASMDEIISRRQDASRALEGLLALTRALPTSRRRDQLERCLPLFRWGSRGMLYFARLFIEWLELAGSIAPDDPIAEQVLAVPLALLRAERSPSQAIQSVREVITAFPAALRPIAIERVATELAGHLPQAVESTARDGRVPPHAVEHFIAAASALLVEGDDFETRRATFIATGGEIASLRGPMIALQCQIAALEIIGWITLLYGSMLPDLPANERKQLVLNRILPLEELATPNPPLFIELLALLAHELPEERETREGLLHQQLQMFLASSNIIHPVRAPVVRNLLTAITPHLSPMRQAEIGGLIIQFADALVRHDLAYVVSSLTPLAKHLANAYRAAPITFSGVRASWAEALHRVAIHGRKPLLTFITAFLPWIEAIGDDETLDRLGDAILDVTQGWP